MESALIIIRIGKYFLLLQFNVEQTQTFSLVGILSVKQSINVVYVDVWVFYFNTDFY